MIQLIKSIRMCILTPLQIDGRELDSIVTNIKSFVRQSTTYQLFSFTSVFHTQQAVAHVPNKETNSTIPIKSRN